jgi:hypothetical protein
MAGQRAATPRQDDRAGSGVAIQRFQPPPLVGLVSRLIIAQSGASAAIGIAYSRRNMPWLVLTVLIAVALCGLAAAVRSGGHTTWLAAICVESGLTAVGLFRFGYASYMGGTLLAAGTLGTLLHPAVARAFAAAPRWKASAAEGRALAEARGEVLLAAAAP